jgi:hypothetical protein
MSSLTRRLEKLEMTTGGEGKGIILLVSPSQEDVEQAEAKADGKMVVCVSFVKSTYQPDPRQSAHTEGGCAI